MTNIQKKAWRGGWGDWETGVLCMHVHTYAFSVLSILRIFFGIVFIHTLLQEQKRFVPET